MCVEKLIVTVTIVNEPPPFRVAFVGGPITGGDTFPGRQIGEILSIKIKIFKRFLKDVENFQESFPEIRRVSISVSPSSSRIRRNH